MYTSRCVYRGTRCVQNSHWALSSWTSQLNWMGALQDQRFGVQWRSSMSSCLLLFNRHTSNCPILLPDYAVRTHISTVHLPFVALQVEICQAACQGGWEAVAMMLLISDISSLASPHLLGAMWSGASQRSSRRVPDHRPAARCNAGLWGMASSA